MSNNQQTSSTHKKPHNQTSASSSSSSYASNTGGYNKSTSHTSGEGRGGYRGQRSGSYIGKPASNDVGSSNTSYGGGGRGGGSQYQKGGGQGSRGGRGRGGASFHHHHRPPTSEGSAHHTHSNISTTTMANPTDVASSNIITSNNNIPSTTTSVPSTHQQQPHHHHHPPHHHQQQQLPSISNVDLAATIGRTSSAPPATGDHNTTTQHPTRIPEHKAHKLHPPPASHVYANPPVMMVPSYGYPYSPYPQYYPQQRPSGSVEIVKPQSSKITIVDPNSGSVVDLKEEKTTPSDNTSSSTTATTTSTTSVDTSKQQPPSSVSKNEITKPEEPTSVETTSKKEETVEQTPVQPESKKPEEEELENKPETTTTPHDNVESAENRAEQVSDQKVSEPLTPMSEYSEQTPTAEESSATFESSQDKIDEDKVVKENPNEIEGFEDSEEEPEDESDKTKIYSREQLLRFKDSCTEPPEKLKSLEIFQSLKSTGTTSRGGGRGGALTTRPFSTPRGTSRGGATIQRGTSGAARGGGRGGKDLKQSTKKAPEKLQKSQNALKLTKEKSKEEMIVDEVKFILNRLTPENYEKLKVEFLGACTSMPGDEGVLNAIIDQIFSYAINLQNFSALYARLCADLSSELKSKIGEENTKQFKRLLLNKCQREFEKEKEEELKNASEKLSPEELEEKEFLLRKKKVGNMIFIGELYLQEMLSEKIMHEVIKRLLINPIPYPSSDDIELLCKLLTTIGKKLDHEKSKKYVNFYFARMETLSQEPTIASRLRFMLKDVIEMRTNNWVARIEKTKATKTRQEAREEAVKQQMDQIKKLEKHHHLRKPNNKTKTSYVTKQSGALQAERYRKMDSKKTLAPGGGIVKQAQTSTQGKTDANTFALLEEEEKEEEIIEEEPVEDSQQVASAEEEEETEEQIKTITERTKTIMSCYFEEGEIDETLESIEKDNLHKTKYFIRGVALAACENSRENEINDAVKLLKKLKEGPVAVDIDTLVDGFIRYFTLLVEEEIYIDIPEIFQHSGKFLGRLIFEKALSFDGFYDILMTVVLDEESPLQESYALEILQNLYETVCSECEYNDALKKPIQTYQEELVDHLFLAEIEDGKHLLNNAMDLMSIFNPTGETYAKFCSFIEDKGYGCFEPSIYYNKCVNEKEKSQLTDFIAVLSDEQILSGILHAKCNEDPVANVEEFREILLEEVREKLEEDYERSLIGIAQHACCTRAKFDKLKPLLNLFVEMKLLNESVVSRYYEGELTVDHPGYEQVKPFLQ